MVFAQVARAMFQRDQTGSGQHAGSGSGGGNGGILSGSRFAGRDTGTGQRVGRGGASLSSGDAGLFNLHGSGGLSRGAIGGLIGTSGFWQRPHRAKGR